MRCQIKRITYQTSLYGSTERASRFSQQKFKVDLLRLGQVMKDSGLIESFRWMHADKRELCKWELGATTFTSTWCVSERTSYNAVKEPISDRLSKRLHDQTVFVCFVCCVFKCRRFAIQQRLYVIEHVLNIQGTI